MVTKLVIIGDSFCHGVGTESPFRDSRNTHWSFGRYLADYYELDYVNLAEPGIGISRTVETAVDYLSGNTDCLVVAGWTNPRRIGIYSKNSMLQILPSYALLGDSSETDVFVKEEHRVRFVANKTNQHHLNMLAELHRTMVENDFFNGQELSARTQTQMFRAWCRVENIKLLDFNVFPGYSMLTFPTLDINFGNIMPALDKHPTRDEQQLFAELFILKYGKK